MSTKQTATKAKPPDAVLPKFADAPALQDTSLTTFVMRPIVIESIDDLGRIASMMAKSQIFEDARTAERAGVKIMLGMELGIGPLAAMRGIQIDDHGNVTLMANLQAALVQRSGRYNYALIESTDVVCTLDAFERDGTTWKKLGTQSLTIGDAHAAGMHMQSKKGGGQEVKYTWMKFPSDMLFARCITRLIKRFCPSVTNGITLYDPDELRLPDGDLQAVQIITTPSTDHTTAQAMEGKAVDTSTLKTANPTPQTTNTPPNTPPSTTSSTPEPQTTTEAGSTTETPQTEPPAAFGGVSGTTTVSTTGEADLSSPALSAKLSDQPTRDEAIKTFQGWAGKMKRLTETDLATSTVPYPEKLTLITGALSVNRARTDDDVEIIVVKTVTLRNCFCNITGAPRDPIPGEIE